MPNDVLKKRGPPRPLAGLVRRSHVFQDVVVVFQNCGDGLIPVIPIITHSIVIDAVKGAAWAVIDVDEVRIATSLQATPHGKESIFHVCDARVDIFGLGSYAILIKDAEFCAKLTLISIFRDGNVFTCEGVLSNELLPVIMCHVISSGRSNNRSRSVD